MQSRYSDSSSPEPPHRSHLCAFSCSRHSGCLPEAIAWKLAEELDRDWDCPLCNKRSLWRKISAKVCGIMSESRSGNASPQVAALRIREFAVPLRHLITISPCVKRRLNIEHGIYLMIEHLWNLIYFGTHILSGSNTAVDMEFNHVTYTTSAIT